MTNQTMTKIVFVALSLLSHHAFASNTIDVIFLNDGSTIRGQLIEIIPGADEYKVQMKNGNIFNYHKDEIEKIVREEKSNNPPVNNPINSVTEKNTPTPKAPIVSIKTGESNRSHTIGFGSHSLSYTDSKPGEGNELSDGDDTVWEGSALSYQYGVNNHLALKAYLYSATYKLSDSATLSGAEAQILITTNAIERGWKFYFGGGIYNDTHTTFGIKEKRRGNAFVLGLGYNWNRVALDLSISMRSNKDYDLPEEFSVNSGGIGLGFRF